jgi:hypothetical protein
MSFALQYNQLILSSDRVAKSLIQPKNIYKITSYKYVDGTTKILAGTDTSIVFVTGISPDRKIVTGIKITLVRPDIFFNWLRKLFQKGLTEESFKDNLELSELLIKSDKQGKALFNSFIKGSTLYRQSESPYRTYTMAGIKNIEKVFFKTELLKKAAGLIGSKKTQAKVSVKDIKDAKNDKDVEDSKDN